jgi:hypothetical protein
MELLVGDRAHVTRLTFENECSLVFAVGAEVAIEAVFGNVQFSADEPLGVRRLPVQNLLERLLPEQLLAGQSTDSA